MNEVQKHVADVSGASDCLPAAQPPSNAVDPSRLPDARSCDKTGNPCGTDTWRLAYVCNCTFCQQYLREIDTE